MRVMILAVFLHFKRPDRLRAARPDVRAGSNSEELSRSKCLPGYLQKRTSPDARHVSKVQKV